MITNTESGTRIDEIASGIYRISTPVPPHVMEGGFSFNQYLVRGDEPLLFHTGYRGLFPLVREAIDHVLPASTLRYISFSHVEADECGSLNQFLAAAPQAVPLCSTVAAVVQINDIADRPPRAMRDGETIDLGGHVLRWIDAPHLPHNWETGYLFDETTSTLLCGDLFTQGGHDRAPLTSDDILEWSEQFRLAGIDSGMPDYWSMGQGSRKTFERLAATAPRTLACMHGSAWTVNGGPSAAEMLRALADRLHAA